MAEKFSDGQSIRPCSHDGLTLAPRAAAISCPDTEPMLDLH
jgi:hypothetical protein